MDAGWRIQSLNDWYGDFATAERASSYVCCTLRPVIPQMIFVILERLEVAEKSRTNSVHERQLSIALQTL